MLWSVKEIFSLLWSEFFYFIFLHKGASLACAAAVGVHGLGLSKYVYV